MSPTKKTPAVGNVEPAEIVFHLVHPTSNGKPLCGADSSTASIGSYVEHLDATNPQNVRWVREVCDADGKPVSPCSLCISLYPSVLLDIVPFDLTIKIEFKPHELFRGYDVSASALGTVRGKRIEIKAYPGLSYFTARWIGSLQFSIDIDADSIVPLVESANKEKRGA